MEIRTENNDNGMETTILSRGWECIASLGLGVRGLGCACSGVSSVSVRGRHHENPCSCSP